MGSITQRKWTTANGEVKTGWRVGYDVLGKRQYRQFKTKIKASRFLETVSKAREVAVSLGNAGNTPLFSNVAAAWLKSRVDGSDGNSPIEPMTEVWYRGQLERHINPVFGSMPIGTITKGKIREFRSTLITDSGLSRRTCQKVVTTLRSVFAYAFDNEIINSDPTERITVRHTTRDVPEVDIHTADEMRLILTTAQQLSMSNNKQTKKAWDRYYPMLLVLIYCGLRISEVRGLTCADVDLNNMTIRIRQRVNARGQIGMPKSRKSNRRVHIPEILRPYLTHMIDGRIEGLVFQTKNGTPLDTVNFRKRGWETVQQKAGVRRLTLHSCRHFFASRQIAAGVNPKEIADQLGHADEAFTLRTYGHLFRDVATEEQRKNRVNALVLTG